MNVKRTSAAALALAMTASLGSAALAADRPADWTPADGARGPMLISPNPFAGKYDKVLVVNGETLTAYDYTKEIPDTWETETITVQLADIANVPAGYVPLRAIAQADHGSASWYKDENQSFFYFNDTSIIVDYNDGSITVGEEKLEGVSALANAGVTYVPISVLEGLEGVTVIDNSTDEGESYEITTPNGTPLVKLAYELMETAGMGMGMKTDAEDLEKYWGETYGFKADMVTEIVAFTGMMTTPDTLAVGKVAEGKTEELKAVLESYQQKQVETFTWYLADQLPKAENAKFVTSGEWFMFVIAENAEEAVTAFETAVAEMGE